MDYLVVLVAGLFAGTLGGIVGTGSSLVLMPILVVMFGPRQAVPIMAVAAFIGNLGRVLAWRREIDWRAVAAYSVPAIPGALLGAPLGVLTGVVVSTGPLTVPLFAFYGLERGAFLGTEAASSLGMYAAKVATFQAFGALPMAVLLQ